MLKTCPDCHMEFEGHKLRKRCPHCAYVHHKLYNRQNYRELYRVPRMMRKFGKLFCPSLEGIDELEPDLYCPERNG